jgi:hypothetical protein
MHHAHGQLLDARRKRGAEHHGLLALGGQLVQLGQVVREAQVEHAVGFVDNQKLHLVELDLHRALQIQQTARRGHHEVWHFAAWRSATGKACHPPRWPRAGHGNA